MNPHFTVARLDDAGGSQIAVYDTPTGRTIGRRRFGADATAMQLVNLALSEEATLVVTLYNQLMYKDLYEDWKTPLLPLVAQNNRDVAPYLGLTQPDQLLVHGGRVATLYDAGGLARAYDLSTSGDPTDPKNTKGTSTTVSMRMIGPRLFIQAQRGIQEYNLQDSSEHYEGTIGESDFSPKVHGVMLGKDYVIVINDPVDRGPVGQPFVVLGAYRRTLPAGSTRELGEPDYTPRVRSSAGVTDWIGADGGVYYLTKDNNLHLLRGSRP